MPSTAPPESGSARQAPALPCGTADAPSIHPTTRTGRKTRFDEAAIHANRQINFHDDHFFQRLLSEVHGSVDTTVQRKIPKAAVLLGPAYLVSVGYMDPGNWATDIAGGSRFGQRVDLVCC